MSTLLNSFRSAVMDQGAQPKLSDALKISESGSLVTYYAPFDYVNKNARVVLVGITPGRVQAHESLRVLRAQLLDESSDEKSLQLAKEAASFSGPMRSSLVALLDGIGLNRALQLDSCTALFNSAATLVHYTSALRYPVLLNGSNYSGSPSIVGTPYLLRMVDSWLATEAADLPDALWVPLGKEPTAALAHLVRLGVLSEKRVLSGLPHPSGANAERISYFLGKKRREVLSSKTNASTLDAARASIMSKLATYGA